MMALMMDSQTPVSFDLHAEIRIDAPVDVVWRSLVEDVGAWWPHSFSDEPRISMEPWVGGRFIEEWDGGSALYALVTHMVTGARLTVSGAMGMRGARQYVKTYELAADGESTVVTTTASMLGDIDDELREGYRVGGEELLQALKAHAEGRAPAADQG
jgi:uncharacterized protein YndB with AHSA1/START domain